MGDPRVTFGRVTMYLRETPDISYSPHAIRHRKTAYQETLSKRFNQVQSSASIGGSAARIFCARRRKLGDTMTVVS